MASITGEEADRIKDSVAPDLLKKPGVTSVDVGLRSAGDGGDDEPVILIHVVSRATAPDDVKGLVSIQGVPVEIVEG